MQKYLKLTGTSGGCLIQPLLHHHQLQQPDKAVPCQTLNISKNWDFTTSLVSLYQCLTTLHREVFFSYVLNEISCVSMGEVSAQCLAGCLIAGACRRRMRAGMRASWWMGYSITTSPQSHGNLVWWCQDLLSLQIWQVFWGRTSLDTDFSVLEEQVARVRWAVQEDGPSRAQPWLRQQGYPLLSPWAAPLPTWLVLTVGCEGCFCSAGCVCGISVWRAEVFMQKLLNFFSQNVPEVYLHWVTSLLVLDSKLK